MTTLNNADVMSSFARGCVETYGNWQTDTYAVHERRIQDLLLQVSRVASLPDFSFTFVDMGDLSKGRMVVHPVVAPFTSNNKRDGHDKASQSFRALERENALGYRAVSDPRQPWPDWVRLCSD